MIIHGDSLEVLREMADGSVDSVVTDPPYGLRTIKHRDVMSCLAAWSNGQPWKPSGKGFMNKSWDAWVPPPELWQEVLRVLKPGGHALVFAGARTQDLMGIALRMAGFEIRDTLQWIYGSGFPKSHNVSLSIDKKLGHGNRGRAIPTVGKYQASDPQQSNPLTANPVDEYQARSEEGERWRGWGTALKPAYEPIILARKPLEGTVAHNVLTHGVGALNIDATRIALREGESTYVTPIANSGGWKNSSAKTGSVNRDCEKGRWPANILLDEEAANMLDEQSGDLPSGRAGSGSRAWGIGEGQISSSEDGVGWKSHGSEGYNDRGGASRFFYVKKANKKERNAGVDGGNAHPTVKPLELMGYLCAMITPEGGTVLDPFAGSGSTLAAAASIGFEFIGIDCEEEYVEIAQQRVSHWSPLDIFMSK